MKKKSCERNDVKKIQALLPHETFLFSKQKIDMMTWLTNIINTWVQVKAKFWRLKQNRNLSLTKTYKPNLPVSNFKQKLLLTNWF